ncbi:hypothetical protein [Caviibacterium pharyngocola]|nr:hypothetical protein [Caviibacterium pharyngocola]
MVSRQIYAVYRGEQNLMDGTAEEIAKKLNIRVESVRKQSTPTAQKRNKGQRLVVIKLGRELY